MSFPFLLAYYCTDAVLHSSAHNVLSYNAQFCHMLFLMLLMIQLE